MAFIVSRTGDLIGNSVLSGCAVNHPEFENWGISPSFAVAAFDERAGNLASSDQGRDLPASDYRIVPPFCAVLWNGRQGAQVVVRVSTVNYRRQLRKAHP